MIIPNERRYPRGGYYHTCWEPDQQRGNETMLKNIPIITLHPPRQLVTQAKNHNDNTRGKRKSDKTRDESRMNEGFE